LPDRPRQGNGQERIWRKANGFFKGTVSTHLNGPPLGRPPKDRTVYDEQLRLEREESRERNAIEGKFGEGKRRYSLGLVRTRLQETSETQIHLAVLVMNLQKILRDFFIFFFPMRFFVKRRQILAVPA
jgi:hypothetical protein